MTTAKQKNRQMLPKVTPANTSWWFDFDIDRRHLALFRFAFFAVLAVDAFLQISHAPRYGSGFNVPHVSWLPLPGAGRAAMLTIEVSLCYLYAMAALGVGMRIVVPIAAALDFYAYFSSQLDSYQHHYLVVLLVVLACFIPWDDPSPRVRSWALRLFCVQLAILYIWAAFAKAHPLWLDGSTLKLQLHPRWVRNLVEKLPGDYASVSMLILFTEAFLAAAWLERRLWIAALPIAVGFHIGVELSGFKIGQFSYVMLAIYTLMIPGKLPEIRAKIPEIPAWVAMGVAMVAGAGILAIAIPSGLVIGLVLLPIAAGAFALRRHWTVGAAHLAACLLVLFLARTTDQLLDYYRFWGGSAKRLGRTDEARAAYQHVLEIQPDHANAHWSLGAMDLDAGNFDDALAHFRRVQEKEPTRARGWVGEAKVLFTQGKRDEARSAVEHALRVDPTDTDAQNLSVRLSQP